MEIFRIKFFLISIKATILSSYQFDTNHIKDYYKIKERNNKDNKFLFLRKQTAFNIIFTKAMQ